MNVIIEFEQKDLSNTLIALDKVAKRVDPKARLQAWREGGKVFAGVLRHNAPKLAPTYKAWGKETRRDYVARYSSGEVVARYFRGALSNSERVLSLRRSKYTVSVGPYKPRKSRGNFRFTGNKADGYYAHMVEFGTRHSAPKPWVEKSFQQSKSAALRVIESELKKLVEA